MIGFWRQVWVVAFRDFKAVTGTPIFLLFLLAPLLVGVMSAIGGGGVQKTVAASNQNARLVLLVSGDAATRYQAADALLRPLTKNNAAREDFALPRLAFIKSHGAADAAVARHLLTTSGTRYEAALIGPASAPQILTTNKAHARYLAALADHVARSTAAGLPPTARASTATISIIKGNVPTQRARTGAGYAAVLILFLLTLLLSAQVVGTFAEEKSNKIIEILASAAPLESIFLGKLVGMYGVALVFISFWAAVASFGLNALAGQMLTNDLGLNVAIGMPVFLMLGLVYFSLSFFLLGALLLAIGAQAPSVRDIQMLSLPITFFQIGMFALAGAAVNAPGSPIGRFAEIFPFSSPFAMAAYGATDAALWPHIVAILWQLLWVFITLRIGAALFRRGVLRSGPGLLARFRRQRG